MHPALKVPDILCLIFGYDFTRCDLVNCSLVCHLWGIWAQDVLLRTQHVSLQAVLQPLAPITRPTYQYRDVPCLEVRNIEEPGWCRFLALSNKITKLAIDCTLKDTGLEHINHAKQKFGGAPFGQLEALHTVAEGVQLDTISLVTVPSLKSVFLSCYTLPSDDLIWVANAMPVMAPNIVRLGITLSTSNRELEMSRYSALKHLELRNEHILPQFWESLVNCQLLTKVVLTWCNKVERRWGDWGVGSVYFPALSTFKFRLGAGEPLEELVLRSRMPMLECLWWDAGTRQGPYRINRMVGHLERHSPKVDTDMLSRLHIGDHSDSVSDSDDDRW